MLVILGRVPGDSIAKHSSYACQCDCGKVCVKKGYRVSSGKTKSCGCLQERMRKSGVHSKHLNARAGAHTAEYMTWCGIRKRCQNVNEAAFVNYGGRGIFVCDRWENFENFLSDMGVRPSKNHSIDRINNDGPYSPENCRWATAKEQCRNTRKNLVIEMNGESKSLSEWCEEIGVSYERTRKRLKRGVSVEMAFSDQYERSNKSKKNRSDK